MKVTIEIPDELSQSIKWAMAQYRVSAEQACLSYIQRGIRSDTLVPAEELLRMIQEGRDQIAETARLACKELETATQRD